MYKCKCFSCVHLRCIYILTYLGTRYLCILWSFIFASQDFWMRKFPRTCLYMCLGCMCFCSFNMFVIYRWCRAACDYLSISYRYITIYIHVCIMLNGQAVGCPRKKKLLSMLNIVSCSSSIYYQFFWSPWFSDNDLPDCFLSQPNASQKLLQRKSALPWQKEEPFFLAGRILIETYSKYIHMFKCQKFHVESRWDPRFKVTETHKCSGDVLADNQPRNKSWLPIQKVKVIYISVGCS